MAAPTDGARINTNVSTAATTHNVNVGSPVLGTLLIVFSRFPADPGAVTFTGYTVLAGPNTSDATDDTTTIFYRWADGAEGASDVLSPTNSVKGAHLSWEILGAEHPASSLPQVSAVSVGTTTLNTATGNSASVVIPPRDTLYLTMAAGDGEVGAYTAAPTNYVNLVVGNSGTGGLAATNCFIGGASRQILASTSDDPGVFTHAAHTGGWTAYTVAIAEAHVFPRHPATIFQDPALT